MPCARIRKSAEHQPVPRDSSRGGRAPLKMEPIISPESVSRNWGVGLAGHSDRVERKNCDQMALLPVGPKNTSQATWRDPGSPDILPPPVQSDEVIPPRPGMRLSLTTQRLPRARVTAIRVQRHRRMPPNRDRGRRWFGSAGGGPASKAQGRLPVTADHRARMRGAGRGSEARANR